MGVAPRGIFTRCTLPGAPRQIGALVLAQAARAASHVGLSHPLCVYGLVSNGRIRLLPYEGSHLICHGKPQTQDREDMVPDCTEWGKGLNVG